MTVNPETLRLQQQHLLLRFSGITKSFHDALTLDPNRIEFPERSDVYVPIGERMLFANTGTTPIDYIWLCEDQRVHPFVFYRDAAGTLGYARVSGLVGYWQARPISVTELIESRVGHRVANVVTQKAVKELTPMSQKLMTFIVEGQS